jgi:SAM-dependent methyltransferase
MNTRSLLVSSVSIWRTRLVYETGLVIERNTEFDPFASVYNRSWGAEYHAQAFPIVERLLLSRLTHAAEVLDVCCGTGQFTARVAQLGFHVHGIDASKRMLGYARENAPDVELTVADVRSFSLNRKFDAAYSVFESLNHVPDGEGLTLAFRCVKRHLRAGAAFLFDLNREEAFMNHWNGTHEIVEDDSVCALRSDYDEATRIATCKITAFEREADCWKRTDFAVRQTCHPVEEVTERLRDAGFSSVSLYDSRDAGMRGELACARTFFLAAA